MKIIVTGDIHMALESLSCINGMQDADLIVINGDLTNYGGKGDAKRVLDAVMSINPRVLAQFGNLDKPEVNEYLEELDINLHSQARLIQKRLCLIGIGGSNQTPFGTPSEFSESELGTFARLGYDQAKSYINLAEPIEKIRIPLILISHTPPVNTSVDLLSGGGHAGSAAIRRFIEDTQPDLCVVGHIHEAGGGIDYLGRTPIYNPGMLKDGGWVEIQIEKSTIQAHLHGRS